MRLFKSGFTVVLIPQKTSRVRQFKVPRVVFVALLCAMVGFAAVGSIAVHRALQMREELAQYEQLKTEHLRQELRLKKVANQVEAFKDEIAKLRELDYKLRVITDLEVERPNPSRYGVGGALDSRKALVGEDGSVGDMELLALLDKDLSRLNEIARYQEESFNNLKAFMIDQKDLIERSPYRWPVRGFISSGFGPRTDPFTGLQRSHDGIDIVSRKGTVVRAPADGIITYTGYDPGLGNMMVIDHGYGVITRYGHNDSLMVEEGQQIKRGDPIAAVGTSGRSTGPHLHYEIRVNDVAVNPLNYILEQ